MRLPVLYKKPDYLTDLSWQVRNQKADAFRPHPWQAHCRYVLISLTPDVWRCELCGQYLEGKSQPSHGQQSLF